ncbi:response regulator [Curtobacterium sp. RRHDQ10]|uniref:response regulator transcription factor n=1 Tax=Curtobacterium phyllosphaerae TaxID=3413379 RepID=UPI003BEFAEE5
MQPVSVLIVDDETLVRFGFELILRASPEIGEVRTTTGDGALDEVRRSRPDVVLLDIRMPGRNGLEVLGDVLALDDPPPVAMLTTFDVEEHLSDAMHLGASGFLLKDMDPDALARAAVVLARGGVVLASGIDRRSLFRTAPAGGPGRPLTVRENATLQLLATGATNAEIAEHLEVSTSTVKEDLRALQSVFGVASRVQVALRAAEAGLLDAI